MLGRTAVRLGAVSGPSGTCFAGTGDGRAGAAAAGGAGGGVRVRGRGGVGAGGVAAGVNVRGDSGGGVRTGPDGTFDAGRTGAALGTGGVGGDASRATPGMRPLDRGGGGNERFGVGDGPLGSSPSGLSLTKSGGSGGTHVQSTLNAGRMDRQVPAGMRPHDKVATTCASTSSCSGRHPTCHQALVESRVWSARSHSFDREHEVAWRGRRELRTECVEVGLLLAEDPWRRAAPAEQIEHRLAILAVDDDVLLLGARDHQPAAHECPPEVELLRLHGVGGLGAPAMGRSD